MSYHNNYNGGYNRGGGFRNNYNNNNHGFNRNNGGFHNNEPRINETDVPQSKHTIFIRGLHGDTTTDEIQDFIGEKIGRVSFDFVKQAQDGSKIYVAVRFEKREEAKEFMATYSNREFMGARCELSWFRDIRRFCAYQRARQLRSNSQRRRRRSDSEGSETKQRRSESPVRRRSRSQQSKSPDRRRRRSESRSSTKSRSESPDDKRISKTRNRSDSRRKSRSSTRSSHRSRSSNRSKSSHGRSASSRRSEGETSGRESRASSRAQSRTESRVESRAESRTESRAESRTESRKSRNNSETRQKRRRTSSSIGSIKEDAKEIKIPKRESPLHIPLPTKTTPMKNSPSPASQKSGFIPPPSMDMDIETSPQHNNNVPMNPYAQHQQFQNYQRTPETSKVSYSMPMDGDAPPKMIIREPEQPPQQYYPTVKVPEHSDAFQPPPPSLPTAVAAAPIAPVAPAVVTMPTIPSFVPRQIGRIEIVMPASLPAAPPPAPAAPPVVAQVTPPLPPQPPSLMDSISAFGAAEQQHQQQQPQMADGSNAQMQLSTTNKLFGHLKAFQSALLSTVKYEIPAKKENTDDEVTGLRLSSMTNGEDDAEEVKAMEREQKLSKLNDDQMMRFLIQKKKFETAFRNDCETYAVVTRALLAKDESMQFKLKMSLLENMEDLHKQFMKRVDDNLDALLAC